jgi:hypothetical protein
MSVLLYTSQPEGQLNSHYCKVLKRQRLLYQYQNPLCVGQRYTVRLYERRRRRSLPWWLTLDRDYQKERYTEYLCVHTGEWFQLSLSSKYHYSTPICECDKKEEFTFRLNKRNRGWLSFGQVL